jgi:pentatricopeptide repeat protein
MNMVLFAVLLLQLPGKSITTNNAFRKLRNCCNINSPQDVKMLCKQGRLEEALQILHNNMEHCVDSSVYASLLQGCVSKKAMPQGKIVHAHIIQTGLFECQETFLWNNLLTLYAKCGNLVDARRALDQMTDPDVVSWTAMITVYARHGSAEEALALFNEMRRSGIEPDHFTFSSLLPVCTDFAVLKLVHEEIIRSGFQSDAFVGNALVDMYAKCGYVKDARDLFDKMPQRNVVSWNAMIAGYVQNGCINEALKLFQTMPERDEVS